MNPNTRPHSIIIPKNLLALVFLSGLLAFSFEMIWLRILAVLFKSSRFIFIYTISFYLTGFILGLFWAAIFLKKRPHPGQDFIALQALSAFWGAVAIGGSVGAIQSWPAFALLRSYLGMDLSIFHTVLETLLQNLSSGRSFSVEQQELFIQFAGVYLGLPSLWILFPSLFMGVGFFCLQRHLELERVQTGTRLGGVQAWSLAGASLGTILGTWFFWDHLGIQKTLRLFLSAGGGFLFFWLKTKGASKTIALLLSAGLTLAACRSIPSSGIFWGTLHSGIPPATLSAEDSSGVAAIRKDDDQGASVYIGGKYQSAIPYGGIHTVLGAVPSLMHPSPEDIFIIGLGSGDTLFSALSRSETRKAVCAEIVKPLPGLLREFHKARPYGGLSSIFSDKRIEIIAGDGRKILRDSPQKWDLIISDAVSNKYADSGLFFSQEYFELMKQKLKPGGLAVSWAVTPRTRDTFIRVFPYVLSERDLLIGSNEPLVFDPQKMRENAQRPLVTAYFAQSGQDSRELIEAFLAGDTQIFDPSFDRSRLTDFNTDLFPKDELNYL